MANAIPNRLHFKNKRTQMSEKQVAQQKSSSWLDSFFNDPWTRSPSTLWPESLRNFSNIKTDISETDTELKITCEVPGLNKKDLKIEVDDDNRILTISGESKSEKKEDSEKWHMVERSSGSFSRTFRLPTYVSTDVKAKLEDGILRMTLAKTEKPVPKKTISIE